MSSLIQSLIDQHPEAFDRLFFIVRLGLFVYIAIGLYPFLRRHLFGGRNVHSSAPRPLNTPAADNTQPVALYPHTAQPAANTPQSLNTPRPLNAPTAYNTQQAAHYTSQTQPSPLRIPSPEQFVAKLIRLYRASIINVRIGHSNLRIACIPALLILAFLFLFR